MKYIAYSIISILIFSSSMLSWEKFSLKEHHYVSTYYYPSESNCEVIIDLDDFDYYGDFTDYMNKKMHYDYNVTLEFQIENKRYNIIPIQHLQWLDCNRNASYLDIYNQLIIAEEQFIVDLNDKDQKEKLEELFLNQYNPIDEYGDLNEKRLSTILNINLSKNSKIETLKEQIILAINEYEKAKTIFPEAQFNLQIGVPYPEPAPPPKAL